MKPVKKEGLVCLDVPMDSGLLIALEADGTCSMTFEPDFNWKKEIHPNAYAPRDLSSVKVLKGGGSGVTVFQGTSSIPSLGSLVMKHGRAKDSREVFSLALISRELSLRGAAHPKAANDMRWRIPEFKMLYISPHHLRDRGTELWIKLKTSVRREYQRHSSDDLHILEDRENHNNMKKIRICRKEDGSGNGELRIAQSQLDIFIDFDGAVIDERGIVIPQNRGFPILLELMDQLIDLQDRKLWKFTIAQKTIGHPDALNGALVHTKGLLNGEMLVNVIDQFLVVIRNLVVLTREDERVGIDKIRKEVAHLQQQQQMVEQSCCSSVSKMADLFCGKAIKKNFDPHRGRFATMTAFGERFRDAQGFDCLEVDEVCPSGYLGRLLKKGTLTDSVFAGGGSSLSAFEVVAKDSFWLEVLATATSLELPAATDLIWTNGLTDAGLHNTFVGNAFLWLFDLGAPEHMPIPAFLTKFLMSFMHVFGMEDDDDDGGGWVCRFVETDDGTHLALTPETAAHMPKMHAAFEYALNRFLDELFDGDEAVRKVLLTYVVLQLLSDASFCLTRWQSKGGGERKYYDRGQNLHKWLWRCLWDLYIATDVLNRWKHAM